MPQVLVKGGTIFGADLAEKGKNHYVLAGCMVSTGFDFQDFKLHNEKNLLKRFPLHAEVIKKLT